MSVRVDQLTLYEFSSHFGQVPVGVTAAYVGERPSAAPWPHIGMWLSTTANEQGVLDLAWHMAKHPMFAGCGIEVTSEVVGLYALRKFVKRAIRLAPRGYLLPSSRLVLDWEPHHAWLVSATAALERAHQERINLLQSREDFVARELRLLRSQLMTLIPAVGRLVTAQAQPPSTWDYAFYVDIATVITDYLSLEMRHVFVSQTDDDDENGKLFAARWRNATFMRRERNLTHMAINILRERLLDCMRARHV